MLCFSFLHPNILVEIATYRRHCVKFGLALFRSTMSLIVLCRHNRSDHAALIAGMWSSSLLSCFELLCFWSLLEMCAEFQDIPFPEAHAPCSLSSKSMKRFRGQRTLTSMFAKRKTIEDDSKAQEPSKGKPLSLKPQCSILSVVKLIWFQPRLCTLIFVAYICFPLQPAGSHLLRWFRVERTIQWPKNLPKQIRCFLRD